MYNRLQDQTALKTLADWLSKFQFQPGPDGLQVVPPPTGPPPAPGQMLLSTSFADIPVRLKDYLVGIRLLRHIPLCYLVPDSRLLPPESIRFFHVDPTWTDRVIEGMLSMADIGTVDLTFTAILLQLIRDGLDAELAGMAEAQAPGSNWSPGAHPLTGFLMRSEAVRRWPDMQVSAFSNAEGSQATTNGPLPILRHEAISDNVYIALIGGQKPPQCVEIREPHTALRFGVERLDANDRNKGYAVRHRDAHGVDRPPGQDIIGVPLRPGRVLDMKKFEQNLLVKITTIANAEPAFLPLGPSRRVALDLERRPFVQVFTAVKEEEEKGSVPTPMPMIGPKRVPILTQEKL